MSRNDDSASGPQRFGFEPRTGVEKDGKEVALKLANGPEKNERIRAEGETLKKVVAPVALVNMIRIARALDIEPRELFEPFTRGRVGRLGG